MLFKVTNNFGFLGHTALKIGIHMSDQSWNTSNECCHKGFFKVQHTVLVQKNKKVSQIKMRAKCSQLLHLFSGCFKVNTLAMLVMCSHNNIF